MKKTAALLGLFLNFFSLSAQEDPLWDLSEYSAGFDWRLSVSVPYFDIRFEGLEPQVVHSILSWDDSLQDGVETHYLLQFYDDNINLYEFVYEIKTREIISTYFKISDDSYQVDFFSGTMKKEDSTESINVNYNLFIPPRYAK